jgi:hypothetical protein
MRMQYFYITFYGQTKYVLRVRACSTSTSGHEIILSRHAVRFNVSLCAGIVGNTVMVPYLLPDWLTAQGNRDFLEAAWRYVPSCEADVVVSARQSYSTLWGRWSAVAEGDISRKLVGSFQISLDMVSALSSHILRCRISNTAPSIAE